MSDDDGAVFAAMQAGARGYVLKGSPGAEITESVRVVASGWAILGQAVAERVGPLLRASARAVVQQNLPAALASRSTELA